MCSDRAKGRSGRSPRPNPGTTAGRLESPSCCSTTRAHRRQEGRGKGPERRKWGRYLWPLVPQARLPNGPKPGPRAGRRQPSRLAVRGGAPGVPNGSRAEARAAGRQSSPGGTRPLPSACLYWQTRLRDEPRSKRGPRSSSRPRWRPLRTGSSGPVRGSSRRSRAPGGSPVREARGPPRAKPKCRAAGCHGSKRTGSSAPNKEGGRQPSHDTQCGERTDRPERRPEAKQGQRTKTMPQLHARGARSCARRPTRLSQAANPSLVTKQGASEKRGRARGGGEGGGRTQSRGRSRNAAGGAKTASAAQALREQPREPQAEGDGRHAPKTTGSRRPSLASSAAPARASVARASAAVLKQRRMASQLSSHPQRASRARTCSSSPCISGR